MSASKKFSLRCSLCGGEIDGFAKWFASDQRCPECGSNRADVKYREDVRKVRELIRKDVIDSDGLWHYFDFLPLLERKNIVTAGEGIVPIHRWEFLEKYAREKFHRNCRVYAHRHDDNYATGTFKDLSGTIVASVLKENGIKSYVAASTGNIAVAYARYLTAAGLSLYAFIPENSSPSQEAEIACFGQQVFRVKGDYARAKEVALEFSNKFKIPLAAGNFDPMRIEAKKTMVLEWLRIMDEFPTVYMQALSGGTGPLAIAKGLKEIEPLRLVPRMPKMILVQSDKCSPMADAWEEAKAKGFPDGWEKTYPIYHNPETTIPTLATGYPTTYPVLSPVVRASGGEIIACDEQAVVLMARLVAFKQSVRMGPAAAIVVAGFIKSLRRGLIKEGEVVILNIGEGMRRAPEFQQKMIFTSKKIKSVDEAALSDKKEFEKRLWAEAEGWDF